MSVWPLWRYSVRLLWCGLCGVRQRLYVSLYQKDVHCSLQRCLLQVQTCWCVGAWKIAFLNPGFVTFWFWKKIIFGAFAADAVWACSRGWAVLCGCLGASAVLKTRSKAPEQKTQGMTLPLLVCRSGAHTLQKQCKGIGVAVGRHFQAAWSSWAK